MAMKGLYLVDNGVYGITKIRSFCHQCLLSPQVILLFLIALTCLIGRHSSFMAYTWSTVAFHPFCRIHSPSFHAVLLLLEDVGRWAKIAERLTHGQNWWTRTAASFRFETFILLLWSLHQNTASRKTAVHRSSLWVVFLVVFAYSGCCFGIFIRIRTFF